MTDPQETPAQAIERLNKEIADLRKLRAQLPMMVLQPYVEDALGHIKEVAARLTVKAAIPSTEAIGLLRSEVTTTSTPTGPPELPETLPTPGSTVTWIPQGLSAGVVLNRRFLSEASPAKYETLILTQDGRLLWVPTEQLGPSAPGPGAGPAAPTSKVKPGDHVREKTTGKTGYVSEVADDKATVALDAGGFVVRALTDLEPV